eukprot:scaffold4815_cov184-Ochromonas_danica.AAC.3
MVEDAGSGGPREKTHQLNEWLRRPLLTLQVTSWTEREGVGDSLGGSAPQLQHGIHRRPRSGNSAHNFEISKSPLLRQIHPCNESLQFKRRFFASHSLHTNTFSPS